MYLSITICTGEALENLLVLYLHYFPTMEEKIARSPFLARYLPPHSEVDVESGVKTICETSGLITEDSGSSPQKGPTLSRDSTGDVSPHPFPASSASRRASRAYANRTQSDLDVLTGAQGAVQPSFGGDMSGFSSNSGRRKSRLDSAAPEFSTHFNLFGEDAGADGANTPNKRNASTNDEGGYMGI